MDHLKKYYESLNAEKLIQVIINNDQYKPEVINLCFDLIQERKYLDTDISVLVQIVEKSYVSYPEIKDACLAKLEEKEYKIDEIKKEAHIIAFKLFYEQFRGKKHWNTELPKISSYFLDEQELKISLAQAKFSYENYTTGATLNLPSG